MSMKNYVKFCYAMGIAVWLIGGSTSPAWAGSRGASVIPPIAKMYGMTYGEWSARWWQWAYSLSVDENPFFDVAGDCSNGANGQSGPVWFLTGVINESGTAVRNCTVPSGKALFFPILNAECSALEGNGSTEEALRACAIGLIGNEVSLAAEIDGVSIGHLEAYRTSSPLFSFGPLPDDNVLQYFGYTASAGATSLAVADGFYVMLTPLSVGQHTIHFTGGIPDVFTLDITYNLTIAPRTPNAGRPKSAKTVGLWRRASRK
jgi:hypothetical protein